MKVVETEFSGLVILEPAVHADDRGYFFESYSEPAYAGAGIACRFVQDNQSYSHYGVIRGLHCQTGSFAQAKLVRAVLGSVLDVVVDIRAGSPTCGRHFAAMLTDQNHRQLFVPRGFLHGFSVLSQGAVVQYKCDNVYNRDSEAGVRYDDPALAIDWRLPPEAVRVSDKDRFLGELRDVPCYRG